MSFVRVVMCGLLLSAAMSAQGGVVIVDEGVAELKASIVAEKPKWIADAGSDVESTLKLWAKAAKWTVIWDTSANYGIVAPMVFRGDFVDGASALIRKYRDAPEPLYMDVSSAQRLLHITREKTQ